MNKDIIVSEIGMKCVDIAQATVAHIVGRDYELMFCNCWEFSFIENKEDINFNFKSKEDEYILEKYFHTIAIRMSKNISDFSYYLEKYYNIRTTYYSNLSSNKVWSMISNITNGKNYIGMWYDQFYLPWAKEIRKQAPLRYDGFILIIGYNVIEKKIICLDIHGSRKVEMLTLDIFLKYIYSKSEHYLIKYEVLKEKKEIDFKNIQSNLYNNFGNLDISSMIYKMRKFEMFLEKDFDYQRELELSLLGRYELSAPTHIEGIKSLTDISRKRNLFSIYLKYVGKKVEDENILYLSDKFKLLAADWQIMVSIMVKSYYLKDFKGLNKKLYNQVQVCIAHEESILNNLFDERKREHKHINYIIEEKRDELNLGYDLLDINKYYNSKAFAKDRSNDEKANFDNLGNFLIIPKNKEIVCSGCHIDIYQNRYDNISCDGQVIDNLDKKYQCLFLIGACDLGAYYGNFRIEYDDNTFEDKIVGFGEWRVEKCEFNEVVIWKGARVNFGEINNEELGYIFQQKIIIMRRNKIKKIILPKNKHIHIWGIIGKQL